MGTPNRVIRDYRFEPEKALVNRKAIIEAERGVGRVFGTNKGVVIPPYYPREPIPAGDPLSPSGTAVELSELADDVLDAISAAASFELREVVLTFSALVAAGTAINIQTGVYVGAGSPASLTGDTDVTLPTAGATFKDDGRIEVHLNGQDLDKGDGSGNGTAEWVSTTQIKLGLKIKSGGQVLIRAPFPTAA